MVPAVGKYEVVNFVDTVIDDLAKTIWVDWNKGWNHI